MSRHLEDIMRLKRYSSERTDFLFVLNIRTIILSIYVALIFVAMFARFYSIPSIYVVFSCITPIIFLVYRPTLRYPKVFFRFICLVLLFYIFYFFALIVRGNLKGAPTIILYFLSNITIAYFLAHEKILLAIVSLPFILFGALVFFLILHNTDPNFFFPAASRNTFSWLALFGASLFYIVQWEQTPSCKPSFWPALTAFLISVWALGRSGIVSTGLLLIGVFLIRFKYSQNRKLFLIISIAIVTTVSWFLLSYYSDNIFKISNSFELDIIVNNPRVDMIKNYMNNASSLKGILGGFDIREDHYMVQWNFNVHNSFLNFHATTGLAAFMFTLLIFIGIIIKSFEYPLFAFLGVALLIRILTDTGALVGPIDCVLLYFLFSWKKTNRFLCRFESHNRAS